jgi:NAD(P)-dependent dehydrogenase (short-subunit alcohol dehydrogenase family)
MTDNLTNKVALVTGGATGIGRATVLAFARRGAYVVPGDIQDEQGAETVRLVQAAGGQAHYEHCDVTQAEQVQALVAAATTRYGRLDYACNNAGIEGQAAPTAACSEANWDRVIAVNLKGVWLSLAKTRSNAGSAACSRVRNGCKPPCSSSCTRSAALGAPKRPLKRLFGYAPTRLALSPARPWPSMAG